MERLIDAVLEVAAQLESIEKRLARIESAIDNVNSTGV